MGRGAPPLPSSVSADDFPDFFQSKIESVRQRTAYTTSPLFAAATDECSLSDFQPVSQTDVLRLLRQSSDKHSPVDPIPTCFLKKCADLLCPFLVHLFNLSLSTGCFPRNWKKANISPILKKASLNVNDPSSYRPISKLPFLAKLLERIVSYQLQAHVSNYNLLPPQQSAYRPHFSCETAVLKITSDILSALDDGKISLLAFLDLSSAFDCVDHTILSECLHTSFGVSGPPLDWFDSFLHGREVRVSLPSSSSPFVSLQSGVPQGSVLGPLLFSLYTCSIVPLVHDHSLHVHLFADDILIYGSASVKESLGLSSHVSRCLDDVRVHLSSLRLVLNPDKTKIMWCQSPRCRTPIDSSLTFNGMSLTPERTVKYLGVILDPHLSFSSNVTRTSCVCFSMLRRVRSVKSCLPRPLLLSLISSLVLSRLDYCISVHAGLPFSTLWRLQRVLHASARLVFGANRSDHIQPLLRALSWPSVPNRVDLRLASLVFLCRSQLAPSYLSDEIRQVNTLPGRACLRSAASAQMCIPRVRRKTFGGRAFRVTAPRAWNRLPPELMCADNEEHFKASLKKFFVHV